MACFPKDAGLDEACFKIKYDMLIVGVRAVWGSPTQQQQEFQQLLDAAGLGKRQQCRTIWRYLCFSNAQLLVQLSQAQFELS